MPPRIKGTRPRPTFLQAWREHAGLTQDAVLEALAAQGIAISKPSLSRLENQRQPYSEPILLGLASVYGCSPADLIAVDPSGQQRSPDDREEAPVVASDRVVLGGVARRLVLLRQWQAASAADFCRKSGINPSAWNNYETGDRRISVNAAMVLCDRFGVTLDWIYRGRIVGLPHEMMSFLDKSGHQ